MKTPAFQFYAADFLSSTKVTLMSADQVGAYILLLTHAWMDEDCSIPADNELLARLTRMGEGWLKGGCKLVLECFVPHPSRPDRLVNLRLLEERAKQTEWRQKSIEGGKKSAEKRKKWREDGLKGINNSNHPSTTVEPPLVPNGNSTFASTTPSSPSSTNTEKDIITGAEAPAPSQVEEVEEEKKAGKVKEATKEEKFKAFIGLFNRLTKRSYKGDTKARRQFEARLKEGKTGEDFKKAIGNCLLDQWHRENPQHLTPEFITRADKLEKYLNAAPAGKNGSNQTNGIVVPSISHQLWKQENTVYK